ncbi:cyclase family protein [Microbacterium soli]|uniref:Cyclase n=1 Tax=Microbacterium soli TaxID=446075 RepID=A0ABP7NCV8_9MICO
MNAGDKRVSCDFEVEFANGGGIQGQGFRLDIDGDDIDDVTLAEYIIRDLRLLMVSEVRIRSKSIIVESHKRSPIERTRFSDDESHRASIDLSHTIADGMVTYAGLPSPMIFPHRSRMESRAHYTRGTEFQIDRIDMVGNTGTYIDVPFHRYHDGDDLAEAPLSRLTNLPGVVVRVSGAMERAIDWHHFAPVDCRGRAILVHTGWDEHWGTDDYFSRHPYLTERAAEYLRDQGAALVGIDSLNIDDTDGGTRPVHSALLEAGIPIVEHLCNLEAAPTEDFDFTAAPLKVESMGSFPVRAHAILPPRVSRTHGAASRPGAG